MRRILTLSFVLQSLSIWSAVEASTSTVKQPAARISNGTVLGEYCAQNPQAASFKAIPFAQPPVGNLRFAPPSTYNQTYPGGVLHANTSAPSCIQFATGPGTGSNPSEDCLYLDIWTPANFTPSSSKEGGGLPVRVWVYGGSQLFGSISVPTYDGCEVPDTGAIMISLNYRLGPLGFFALDSAGIKGNQAIQDILMGLQWVQDNIRSFGGDPKKVMLHGQSAGATNSFIVATLPQAPSLIKSVVMQSGGGRDITLNDNMQYVGKAYARALNCSITDTACLHNVPVANLIKAYQTAPLLNEQTLHQAAIININAFAFRPYIDGELIKSQPLDVGVKVPAIFGSTKDDGTLFAISQFYASPGGPLGVNGSTYTKFLNENFGNLSSAILQRYPLSRYAGTPSPAFYAISEIIGVSVYTCSAYRGANKAAQDGVPVWSYYFDHQPTCPWLEDLPSAYLGLLGATHTAEIPFVLGTTSNLPLPAGNCSMTAQEADISHFLADAWTQMALLARPRAHEHDQWPRYRGANHTSGINITSQIVDSDHLDYSACEFWDYVNDVQRRAAYSGTLGGANSTTA